MQWHDVLLPCPKGRSSSEGGYPMRDLGRSSMVSAIVAMALISAAAAQFAAPSDPGFAVMEAQQNAANAKAGSRIVPGRVIPLPDTASPQLQSSIAALSASGLGRQPQNGGGMEGTD
jgi:hypothetical protein